VYKRISTGVNIRLDEKSKGETKIDICELIEKALRGWSGEGG
jgi:hypothetical protein